MICYLLASLCLAQGAEFSLSRGQTAKTEREVPTSVNASDCVAAGLESGST